MDNNYTSKVTQFRAKDDIYALIERGIRNDAAYIYCPTFCHDIVNLCRSSRIFKYLSFFNLFRAIQSYVSKL